MFCFILLIKSRPIKAHTQSFPTFLKFFKTFKVSALRWHSICGSSWSGPGFPSLAGMFLCGWSQQQTPHHGHIAGSPLVCTWWCELWWGYEAVGGSLEGVWFWLMKAALLEQKWVPCWGTLGVHGGADPGPSCYSMSSLYAEAKHIVYLHMTNRATK